MAWVKIDDHFDEHPKLAVVGPLGWGVWLAGLAYCNRNLTDGFIPLEVAESIGGRWRIRVPVADGREAVWTVSVACGMQGQDLETEWVIGVLVRAGLWEEAQDGYRVHDYSDYQPTKAETLALRAKRAEVGAMGGKAKASAYQNASKLPSKPLAKVCPDPDPGPDPGSVADPTKDPTPLPPASGGTVGSASDDLGKPDARKPRGNGGDSLALHEARFVALFEARYGSPPALDRGRLPGKQRSGLARALRLAKSSAHFLDVILPAYLADEDPWIVERRHGPEFLDASRINRYTTATPKRAAKVRLCERCGKPIGDRESFVEGCHNACYYAPRPAAEVPA